MDGTVIAGRFEILGRAGGGGMGTVHRARDRATGETVALKVLTSPGPYFASRFAREAEVLAELQHPSIVRHVAHGESEQGEPYIAMEWLDGQDLSTRLAHGPLSLAECSTLGADIADALAAAHARGFVHRDMKPANVFLVGGDARRVKLLDFGIARAMEGATGHTRTGAMLGTPGYMAPEQARGERDVDERADVFSLGAVLFECITGSAPFRGDNVMAVLAKVLLESPTRPSELRADVPPALDEIVLRMLDPDRAKRPRSASVVREELMSLGRLSDAPAAVLREPTSLSGGEERVVSVLLVAGPSTGERESQRPGSTIAERVRRVAEEHEAASEPLVGGAIVVRVMGDARDQALAAARCALALRDIVGATSIALASARSNLAASGPTAIAIDRAAQLLGHAPSDGGIHLDDVTAALLDARFDVQHIGERYVLLGEHRDLEPVRKLLGRPTPCVGRARELATLESAWADCKAERAPTVVLVTAPAGVGKSRLRYELVHRVTARDEGAAVWLARGDPSSAGSSLGMIARATKAALGLADDQPLEVRRREIRARVRRSFDGQEAATIERYLGELCATPSSGDDDVQLRAARADPVLMGDRIRAAWERWATAECERAPVLLVLEDLHWGDWPSIRLIDSVLSAAERPLMVLGLARPEVTTLFPQLWSERSLLHVRLRELSAKASEELVRDALGESADTETVARLVARADGNAFFLEELIRAVAEERSTDLPETVLAVMQHRLERLDPEERRTLRAGAVFGEVFTEGGASALCGSPQQTSIDTLVARELVTSRPSAKLAGVEYVFRHALVQETAYAMLTEDDRRAGHRLAGEWLAAAGEHDADVLARHFEKGGAAETAVAHYLDALRAAFRANDLDGAIERCNVAEACGPTPAQRAELTGLRATVERWRAQFPACADAAVRALDLTEPGSVAWLLAVANAAHALGKLARRDEVIAVARRAEGAPLREGTAGHLAVALSEAAMQCYFGGAYDEANAFLVEVDRHDAEGALADPGLYAVTLRARAYRAWFHGDLAATMELIQASADAFTAAGDRRNTCTQNAALGYIAMELGLYGDAEPALRHAIATAESMGLSGVAATARQNLGLVLSHLGSEDEALEVIDRSVAALEAQGDRRMAAASRAYRARILARRGDLIEASAEIERAIANAEGSPQSLTNALATAAAISLASGEVERASKQAEQAVERLESVTGLGEGEAAVWLVAAETRLAQRDLDGARAAVARGTSLVQKRALMISDEAKRRVFGTIEEHAGLAALAVRLGMA